MIKHGSPVQYNFKDQNRYRRSTNQDDNDHLDTHRKDDLYWMEANPCGHINIHV